MTAPNHIDLNLVSDSLRASNIAFRETDEVNVILATTSGIAFGIRFEQPHISLVSTVAVEAISSERFAEVLGWVQRYNYTSSLPCVVALKDERRRLTVLEVKYDIPGAWQYTDRQFTEWLGNGISGVLDAVRAYVAAFS